MDNLEKLKILILEEQYPRFTDEQLQSFLDDNKGNVYAAAADLCLLKANTEKKITVGPITIENADPEFWMVLQNRYIVAASSFNANPDDPDSGGSISGGSKYTIKLIKSYG